MSTEEIYRQLAGVFEEVLGQPVQLRPETTAADVDGWDSVAHVMLVLASERQFGVKFDGAEIASAANVGEFVDLVASKLSA